MPADLLKEAKESLDTAQRAINKISPMDAEIGAVRAALVALHDTVAQLCRIVGVPNAIEVEPGARPRVTTDPA